MECCVYWCFRKATALVFFLTLWGCVTEVTKSSKILWRGRAENLELRAEVTVFSQKRIVVTVTNKASAVALLDWDQWSLSLNELFPQRVGLIKINKRPPVPPQRVGRQIPTLLGENDSLEATLFILSPSLKEKKTKSVTFDGSPSLSIIYSLDLERRSQRLVVPLVMVQGSPQVQ